MEPKCYVGSGTLSTFNQHSEKEVDNQTLPVFGYRKGVKLDTPYTDGLRPTTDNVSENPTQEERKVDGLGQVTVVEILSYSDAHEIEHAFLKLLNFLDFAKNDKTAGEGKAICIQKIQAGIERLLDTEQDFFIYDWFEDLVDLSVFYNKFQIEIGRTGLPEPVVSL